MLPLSGQLLQTLMYLCTQSLEKQKQQIINILDMQTSINNTKQYFFYILNHSFHRNNYFKILNVMHVYICMLIHVCLYTKHY